MKLENKTYDYDYWEIVGLPYAHIIDTMGYTRHKIEEYIPMCFTKQAYLSIYSLMFSPIPDQCIYEPSGRPLIDPLIVQKKIGKPKKSRK